MWTRRMSGDIWGLQRTANKNRSRSSSSSRSRSRSTSATVSMNCELEDKGKDFGGVDE